MLFWKMGHAVHTVLYLGVMQHVRSSVNHTRYKQY